MNAITRIFGAGAFVVTDNVTMGRRPSPSRNIDSEKLAVRREAILQQKLEAPFRELTAEQAQRQISGVLSNSLSQDRLRTIQAILKFTDLTTDLATEVIRDARVAADRDKRTGKGNSEYTVELVSNERNLRQLGLTHSKVLPSGDTQLSADPDKWHALRPLSVETHVDAQAQVRGAIFSPKTGKISVTFFGPKETDDILSLLTAHRDKPNKRPDRAVQLAFPWIYPVATMKFRGEARSPRTYSFPKPVQPVTERTDYRQVWIALTQRMPARLHFVSGGRPLIYGPPPPPLGPAAPIFVPPDRIRIDARL